MYFEDYDSLSEKEAKRKSKFNGNLIRYRGSQEDTSVLREQSCGGLSSKNIACGGRRAALSSQDYIERGVKC